MKLESVPDVSISIKNTFIEVHDKSDDDSDSEPLAGISRTTSDPREYLL